MSWTSAPETIATVDPTGLVKGIAEGNATITATLSGISGSTSVTVTSATLTTITIMPPNPSLANGTELQLTAIGTFSDGTTDDLTTSVFWSATGDLGTVDLTGFLTATAVGTGTIVPTQSGVSGTTPLTATPALLTSIAATPAHFLDRRGNQRAANRHRNLQRWHHPGSYLSLAELDHYSCGHCHGRREQPGDRNGGGPRHHHCDSRRRFGVGHGHDDQRDGDATYYLSCFSATSAFSTASSTFTVPVKGDLNLIASAVLSDGSIEDVTNDTDWISSNPKVASIITSGSSNAHGRLMAKKSGTTTITATVGSFHGTAIVILTP